MANDNCRLTSGITIATGYVLYAARRYKGLSPGARNIMAEVLREARKAGVSGFVLYGLHRSFTCNILEEEVVRRREDAP